MHPSIDFGEKTALNSLIIFNYYRKYNHHRKEVYVHVMPHKKEE
jgi:hypothetical protein